MSTIVSKIALGVSGLSLGVVGSCAPGLLNVEGNVGNPENPLFKGEARVEQDKGSGSMTVQSPSAGLRIDSQSDTNWAEGTHNRRTEVSYSTIEGDRTVAFDKSLNFPVRIRIEDGTPKVVPVPKPAPEYGPKVPEIPVPKPAPESGKGNVTVIKFGDIEIPAITLPGLNIDWSKLEGIIPGITVVPSPGESTPENNGSTGDNEVDSTDNGSTGKDESGSTGKDESGKNSSDKGASDKNESGSTGKDESDKDSTDKEESDKGESDKDESGKGESGSTDKDDSDKDSTDKEESEGEVIDTTTGDLAEATLKDAKDKLDRAQAALDQAKSDKTTSEGHVKAAEENLAQAKNKLADAKNAKSTDDAALAKAQAEVDKAQAAYDKAVANADTNQQELNKAQDDLAVAQDNVASTNQKVEQLEDALRQAQDSSGDVDWSKVDNDTVETVAENILYQKINDYRVDQGLNPLPLSEKGSAEAKQWSEQMSRDGYISHREFEESNAKAKANGVDKNGNWVSRPVSKRENVLVNYYGENNYVRDKEGGPVYTNGDPEALANTMFNQWKNSKGHDKNFMGQDVNSQGIGVHIDEKGRAYATWRGYDDDSRPAGDRLVNLESAADEYGFVNTDRGVKGPGAAWGEHKGKPVAGKDMKSVPTVDRNPDIPNERATTIAATQQALDEARADNEAAKKAEKDARARVDALTQNNSEVTTAKTALDDATAKRDDASVKADQSGKAVANAEHEVTQAENQLGVAKDNDAEQGEALGEAQNAYDEAHTRYEELNNSSNNNGAGGADRAVAEETPVAAGVADQGTGEVSNDADTDTVDATDTVAETTDVADNTAVDATDTVADTTDVVDTTGVSDDTTVVATSDQEVSPVEVTVSSDGLDEADTSADAMVVDMSNQSVDSVDSAEIMK